MTNTVMVDAKNKKLFNNLSILDNTLKSPIKSNIYQLYYATKFDCIILDYSSFDNSVAMFCMEFKDKVKTFVYIDGSIEESLAKNLLEYSKSLYFLVDDGCKYADMFSEGIVIKNNIINNSLYNKISKQSIKKQSFISCFMDNLNNLPDNVTKLLYPNSTVKLRLFNNPNIKHVQNLGMITEENKWQILMESEFYLDINKQYATEASLCKCKIMDENSLSENLSSATLVQINNNYKTYEDLLEQCQKI